MRGAKNTKRAAVFSVLITIMLGMTPVSAEPPRLVRAQTGFEVEASERARFRGASVLTVETFYMHHSRLEHFIPMSLEPKDEEAAIEIEKTLLERLRNSAEKGDAASEGEKK
jgi:hypothetical protein